MSGYPHNLLAIYPVVSGVQKIRHHAYPHNLSNINPPVTRTEENVAQEPNDKGYPHNLSQIHVAIIPRGKHPLVSRSQGNEQGYPYNSDNIYPATIDIEAYPHNLDHIYSTMTWRSKMSQDTVSYPFFNLCKIYHYYIEACVNACLFLLDPPILEPFFGYLSLYTYGPKLQYPEFEICE